MTKKYFLFALPLLIIAFIAFFPTRNTASQRYIEDNGASTNVELLESDLQVNPGQFAIETQEDIVDLSTQVLQEGEGEGTVANGDQVTVQYRGWFASTGETFDSSLDNQNGFSFTVGNGSVIAGWDQGVVGMKLGEVRRLFIPGSLAYGDTPEEAGSRPAGDLMFDVEVIGIL